MSRAPGLYVHLPFCSHLCPYCDFYVLTGDDGRRRGFLDSLAAEADLCRAQPWPDFVTPTPSADFDTLYLGGGTPSLVAPEELHRLLDALSATLPIAADCWVGLEANPEDVRAETLAAWRQTGVRFLSLGIQSFAESNLRFLGRIHAPEDCRQSARLARAAGFDTLSFDLIYGLPGQSRDAWRADLLAAVELEPDHLSCYQLTVEPGTPFGFRRARGRLTELPEQEQADLFFLTHQLLADHGFAAYEVSNFARTEKHRSRHNRKYWQHTPYLGLGPSAHSFAAGKRWWNLRKIRPWEARIAAGRRPLAEHEDLSDSQLALERIMLGLRTPAGVDLDRLPGHSGAEVWAANRRLVEELVDAGHVQVDRRRLLPRLSGMALAEALAGRFDLRRPASP